MTNDIASDITRRKPGSLAQSLVDDVCRMISDGVVKPGDKLPTEVELMAVGGVSRATVREALSRLQVSGVVETRRGIGTFVLNVPGSSVSRLDPATIVTLQDVIAILDVRMSFEIEAAGLAALRRTDEQLERIRDALDRFEQASDTSGSLVSDFQFHLQVATAANNRYFVDIVTHFGTSMFPRARLNSVAIARLDRQQKHERLVREHEHIYDAVARRDYDASRAAMRVHLANSRARVVRSHEDMA
ncbi:FadR/GntR family transcriptional regulator [Pseudomonas sp. UBA4194]|uniref:FadR/GntR family transcriptional regulator n=1 Tax=Pseudomonas sp. UBA4194 TaxID=1947317 RepID=UPI0025CE374D|nr:FadR/GntR family transcriptional regulator [Pseudomonas sp. UBA4194]